MSDLAAEVIATFEDLDEYRITWLEHWQRVANYVVTNRNDYILQKTPGQRREQWVYDSTPVWANEQFAAGLHSRLTSPTLQWLNLKAEDERWNDVDRVRAWLDEATRRMYALFNAPRTGFGTACYEAYIDLGSIGTSCMSVLESWRNGVTFSTRHMKECVFGENEDGRVDTVCRKWTYTAKQAFQAWGADAGELVVKAVSEPKTMNRPFTFLHLVRPRLQRDPARNDGRNKPWQSIYVCQDGKHVISEGGFNEFPYMCMRFSKITGEVYGRGPGIKMLPHIAMLNEMVKTILKAAQKIVDPPIMAPDDGFILPIKTTPGSFTYYRAGMRDKAYPLETNGNIPIGIELLNSQRQMILQGFYNDLMRMPSDPDDPSGDGKGITATYTLRDRDEKMLLQSPMLARMQSEFLGPLCDRVFAIMWRQSAARRFGPGSMLPPPPPEISGLMLRTEFVSPISIAQKAGELDGIGRLIQLVGILRQQNPNLQDVLDTDNIQRIAARDLNVPAIALISPDRAAALAQQRAQAEAEMNAHSQAMAQAQALKDGSAGIASLAQAATAGQQQAAA